MSIKTITALPPQIIQSFNSVLMCEQIYNPFYYIDKDMGKIIKIFNKKIRLEMTGKQKEFDKLKQAYQELYERAKIKKENYETALKNAPKMSYISSSGATCIFKRF